MTSEESEFGRRTFLKSSGLTGLGVLGLGYSSVDDAAADPGQSSIRGLPERYQPYNQNVKVLPPRESSKSASKKANIRMVLVVENNSDNQRKLVVLAKGESSVKYTVKADVERGSYTVENLEVNPDSVDKGGRGSAHHTSAPTEEDGSAGTMASTTYDPFTAGIETHDPADYRLCQTEQHLEWTYDNNYDATYIESRDWWSKWWNPTGAGTHWYHDYSEFVDRRESSGECYTECFAQYYNDDWNDPNHRTYATHEIGITGYASGAKDYFGVADSRGDDYDKLHSHIYSEANSRAGE